MGKKEIEELKERFEEWKSEIDKIMIRIDVGLKHQKELAKRMKETNEKLQRLL